MAAVGNYEIVTGSYGPYTTAGVDSFDINAPSGKVVIGGFFEEALSGGSVKAVWVGGYPISNGTAWRFLVRSQGSVSQPASGTYHLITAEMG